MLGVCVCVCVCVCVQLCVCVAVGLSNDQLYEEEAGREEAANMSDCSAGRQQTTSHQVESLQI